MYVCMYVWEKYIKSISYKTAVVFGVHAVLYHLISQFDTMINRKQQQATAELLLKIYVISFIQ